jgi:hypothetical protein
MKKIIILFLVALLSIPSIQGQTDINQNGLKTTVINSLAANATQAKRYEIATVGYNSYHWQFSGIIIIELFESFFETGYEKYIIENGFGQGANYGSPVIRLIESRGQSHNAKITLGTAYDLSTNYGGFVNKALPIFVDIGPYRQYKARITYLQDKVTELSWSNQIKIDDNPSSTDIPDFAVSTEITNNSNINCTGNLRITGAGNHFIQNGNVGIGTTSPDQKLTVKGKIHAEEVIVDLNVPVADYVFKPNYKLMPLPEVEQFVKTNSHLPEIPSATEITKNGLSMGEMQNKLLQKVEELTLYAIQQNKKIETLEKRINELETK